MFSFFQAVATEARWGQERCSATAMVRSEGKRLSFPGPATNFDGGADACEGEGGTLHVAQVLKTLVLEDSCAHCGKQVTALKRCSVCTHACYCGAACQKTVWNPHKKTNDVWDLVLAAEAAGEWRGVLELEGRMDELMEGQPDASCEFILASFLIAHLQASFSADMPEHLLSVSRLGEQRILLLGKMQRFRDQGEAICSLALSLIRAGKRKEAAGCYQRARLLGAAHGFISVECTACLGLGAEAMSEGRYEEGVELLRNALAAAQNSSLWELIALHSLISALFLTDAIDQLQPLVLLYREAAKAESVREGCSNVAELRSVYYSARLHEVL